MKLTDKVVRSLPLPQQGSKIYYDDGIPGFGVRATKSGQKSYGPELSGRGA
jgi:hypothetical protein